MLQALLAQGYERLPPSDPNAYADGTRRYTTYRSNGVRVAFGSNRALGEHRGMVVEYDEDETSAVLHALITDPDVRWQGRATEALAQVLRAADDTRLELYVEPVPLKEGEGLDRERLARFYAKFGFEAVDIGGRVLRRSARPEPTPEPDF